MKMKRRSHRYEINRLRPRHGHEYNRYIMSLSMMTLTCVKQHLSNIWNPNREKVKQRWGWAEKKHSLQKIVYKVTDIILMKFFQNKQKQPPEMLYKRKVFLTISQNFQENTCAYLSLNKLFQSWHFILNSC